MSLTSHVQCFLSSAVLLHSTKCLFLFYHALVMPIPVEFFFQIVFPADFKCFSGFRRRFILQRGHPCCRITGGCSFRPRFRTDVPQMTGLVPAPAVVKMRDFVPYSSFYLYMNWSPFFQRQTTWDVGADDSKDRVCVLKFCDHLATKHLRVRSQLICLVRLTIGVFSTECNLPCTNSEIRPQSRWTIESTRLEKFGILEPPGEKRDWIVPQPKVARLEQNQNSVFLSFWQQNNTFQSQRPFSTFQSIYNLFKWHKLTAWLDLHKTRRCGWYYSKVCEVMDFSGGSQRGTVPLKAAPFRLQCWHVLLFCVPSVGNGSLSLRKVDQEGKAACAPGRRLKKSTTQEDGAKMGCGLLVEGETMWHLHGLGILCVSDVKDRNFYCSALGTSVSWADRHSPLTDVWENASE